MWTGLDYIYPKLQISKLVWNSIDISHSSQYSVNMKIIITGDTHYGYSRHGNDENVKMIESIKKENPDILIHTGDYGSSSLDEREEYWRVTRGILGSIVIIAVNGNHDYWDATHKVNSIMDITESNIKVFEKYSIYHPFTNIVIKGISIRGMDGWYFSDVRTHDPNYIPHYFPEGVKWLRDKSDMEFDSLLPLFKKDKQRGDTTILVTHFGFIANDDDDWKSRESRIFGQKQYFGGNPKYENYIDDVDYLLYGHSHHEFEGVASNGKTKVINAGSDYEFPNYRILEVT